MTYSPQLVAEITRRVLETLNGTVPPAEGPRALLLGEGDWSALGRRYTLEGADAYCQSGSLAGYDFVLLSLVPPVLLADLALGRGNCPAARAVSAALLAGIPVYLAVEGLSHRACQSSANPRYYALLEGYVAQLSSFGVVVNTAAGITACLTTAETRGTSPATAGDPSGGLLTAERARKLCRDCGGTLRLAPGTVITPLARDVLREKQVRLEEEPC